MSTSLLMISRGLFTLRTEHPPRGPWRHVLSLSHLMMMFNAYHDMKKKATNSSPLEFDFS